MTTFIAEAATSSGLDALSTQMLIGGALVVVILLILWSAGVLKRLKNFSLKFFKNIGLQMGFHKNENPSAHDEGTGKIELEKSVRNREARKRQTKKLTDVAGLKTQISSVLAERKKALKPLPPNFEASQIEKGFSKLDAGDIVEAKKCFDSILQRNPKSVEGCFGLARVLELWKDIPNALKYYWEATRVGDKTHPKVIEAQAKLDELSKSQRQQNLMQSVIKNGPGANSFWFEDVPDAKNLARYFVALSNSEDGGNILIGIDKTTRKPAGSHLGEWEHILDAVRLHYVTAPCLFEVFTLQQPRCILVIVQRGLNRPYRLNDDDEAKVFVPDGDGEVREASPGEIDELRKKKRG